MATNKHNPSERPIKPWPDFPLFAHVTGRWAKKTGGKLRNFGAWDGPNGAYERYLASADGAATAEGTSTDKVARKEATRRPGGAAKPWPGYLLYPHPTRQRARKIRRKTYHFGTDAEVAYKRYQDEKDDLEAGRTPKPRGDYHRTVKDMVNQDNRNQELWQHTPRSGSGLHLLPRGRPQVRFFHGAAQQAKAKR